MGNLTLRNIEKSFDGKTAVKDINLSVGKGEFFTFLGPSGCGKTTILRLIAGFIQPQKGRIFLADRDITLHPPEKRRVGMVFQNYALFPFLTVRENIEYGLKIAKKPAKEIRQTVDEFLEMIGLSGFDHRKISELSGGEQQRVALARSLVTRPKVLLLDEPLSNLDTRLRERMRAEIKALQKSLDITTIFVTHDQTEALTLSDRIGVFNEGRLVQAGTPALIYSEPATSFVAGFIGETNLLPVRINNESAQFENGLCCLLRPGCNNGRYLSIRPQDIRLSNTDPGEENTFRGRLEEATLHGAWIGYQVNISGISFRSLVLNTISDTAPVKPGEDVFITLPRNRITILES